MSEREVLIAYLRMKVDQEDWHAVSDAANDLRVLDAESDALARPELTGARVR